MEGAGIFALAAMLLIGVPFGILADYNEYFGKLGPREAALAEASHGAAMIVLPVLVLMRVGSGLPPWLRLVLFAAMIWGGLRLFNGAKFSVGWRDPKLIARACIKIGLAVVVFRVRDVGPVWAMLISLVGWWLLVTGLTKLVLLLRGFPSPGIVDLGTPHGNAGFSRPDDPDFRL